MKPIIFLLLFAIFAFSQCVPTDYKRLKATYDEMQLGNSDDEVAFEVYPIFTKKGEEKINPYHGLYELMDSLSKKKAVEVEILTREFIDGNGMTYMHYFWIELGVGYLQYFENEEIRKSTILQLTETETSQILSNFEYFMDYRNYTPTYYNLNCGNQVTSGIGDIFIFRKNRENYLLADFYNCYAIVPFFVGNRTYEKIYAIDEQLKFIKKKYNSQNDSK